MPPPFNNPHTLKELRALTDEYFKPKPGENIIKILPLPPTQHPFIIDYFDIMGSYDDWNRKKKNCLDCFVCDNNLDALKYEQFRAKLILEAEKEI